MPNEIWAALVGVGGALIGVWYGAKLTKKAAIELVVQQEKGRFLSSFSDTLLRLSRPVEEQGIGEANSVLQEHYSKHLAAYLRLRVAVPSTYHNAIEAAWAKYTQDDEYELQEEKEIYRFAYVLNGKNDEEMQTLAIKHINALIGAIHET
ncbi:MULTISPECIES: hypothetical protein [unclassified Limnobacter]|uniref:hypothetical protein n=1 Tax=unclassified Limnobacter TaxID=2630203 RepID=UPI000156C52D|nr:MULTISPECIES: hypothetical protein [unclassified Limnobacter]EDM83661.1 hypothetical protein LMED105_12857 [Limnobacter sp. MED105]MAZ08706.1 hypothetical protein [Sutterellaceae bacterium]|tara:strand:- start:8225 stop:8674 length:450 start_codon:yes stop_codon:yes gene_type:complete